METLVLDRGGRCLKLPIPLASSTLTKSIGRLEEAGYVIGRQILPTEGLCGRSEPMVDAA